MTKKLQISLMKVIRHIGWFALAFFWGLFPVAEAQVKPPSMNPEYFAVLRSGDVRQLREALDHGASANARDALSNTPLMHAAVYGDLSCMRLLINRGADVTTRMLLGTAHAWRSITSS
jgi:hypothetical protein